MTNQKEAGHTAWTLEGDHDWSDCSVDFNGGGYHYTIYEPGRERPIAFVIGDGEDWRDDEDGAVRKRALAMAAAPKMAASLKAFVAHYPMGINPMLDQAFRDARAALSKAGASE